MVQSCKKYSEIHQISKTCLLFILSYLLHEYLQLRGRIPYYIVWSWFSIVAKLFICHQPGIQYIPTELFLILLCAHLRYYLRSYTFSYFISTLIYNIEFTNVKAHIPPHPRSYLGSSFSQMLSHFQHPIIQCSSKNLKNKKIK